jgi:hypothetical protein
MSFARFELIRVFLWVNTLVQAISKGGIMKNDRIISYRRRCRQIGTGLSHFILLVSKTGKK